MEKIPNIFNECTNYLHSVLTLYKLNDLTLQKFEKTYHELITDFIENLDAKLIYVQRGTHQLSISNSNHQTEKDITCVIIKNQNMFSENIPIAFQLNIINIPESQPFETLKSIINLGIGSLVESIYTTNISTTLLATSNQNIKKENDKRIIVKKKLKDLSLTLSNISNDMNIPSFDTTSHEKIKRLLEEAPQCSKHNFSEYLPLDSLLNDSTFLNELQKIANSWILSINKVIAIIETHLRPDFIEDSVTSEVSFWKSAQSSLMKLHTSLETSNHVLITFDILSKAKRTVVINANDLNTSLEVTHYLELVENLNTFFFATFPLLDFSTCEKFEDLNNCCNKLEKAFKKFRNLSVEYPIPKMIQFVNMCSIEFITILSSSCLPSVKTMLEQDDSMFSEVMDKKCKETLSGWNDVIQFTKSVLRELIRKRQLTIKFSSLTEMNQSSMDFKDRLTYIVDLRTSLQENILLLQDFKSNEFLESLMAIYDNNISENIPDDAHIMDLPTKTLQKTLMIYKSELNIVLDKVRLFIQDEILRSVASKSPDDQVFAILQKYKSFNLQEILTDNIRNTLLLKLESKIKVLCKLDKIDYNELNITMDIPVIYSKLIWNRQTKKRLHILFDNCELILGNGWQSTLQGSHLYQPYLMVKDQLDENKIYQTWLNNIEVAVTNQVFSVRSAIFKVVKGPFNTYELLVNFNYNLLHIFKEVRNLLRLGFDIPSNVLKAANILRSIHPFALKLQNTIQVFVLICKKQLIEKDLTTILLVPDIKDIFDILKKSINCTWDTLPLFNEEIISDDNNLIGIVSTKTEDLLQKCRTLNKFKLKLTHFLGLLLAVDLTNNSNLTSIMFNIKSLVKKLVIQDFSNINLFLENLNRAIFDNLQKNLKAFLEDEKLTSSIHHIYVKEQKLLVTPPVEHILEGWLTKLNLILFNVSNLTKVTKDQSAVHYFDDVLFLLEPSIVIYFDRVFSLFDEAKNYWNTWHELSFLWNNRENEILNEITLKNCYELLAGLLQHRKVFDTIETNFKCGDIIVFEYEQAQVRVNDKFDQWQTLVSEKLQHLYNLYAREERAFLLKSIATLEKTKVNISSIFQLSTLLAFLNDLKTKKEECNQRIALLKKVEQLLKCSHWIFDDDFIYVIQLENDFVSLYDMLSLKDNILEENKMTIINLFESKSKGLTLEIEELYKNWNQNKPIGVDEDSKSALKILAHFEDASSKLFNSVVMVESSSKTFSLPISINVDCINSLNEELQNMKTVWTVIDHMCKTLDNLLKLSWKGVDMLEINTKLSQMTDLSGKATSKILQYHIYQSILDKIGTLQENLQFLLELKDAPIKPRHWKQLLPAVEERLIESETFTLNDILSTSITKATVTTIISKAQAEMILEESLSGIETHWKEQTFEVLNKNDLLFLKNWKHIIELCNEDIDTLNSMKASIYYKIFETDATDWEHKLASLKEIFSYWIEAQSSWAYLEGLLIENKDIKKTLPFESSKFMGVTVEFKAFVSKVINYHHVIDILAVENCSQFFKRVCHSLSKVKKSLNEFLDCQRALFPRFYFVGNEDLLHIIGSGSNLYQISKYIGKMFSSIRSIIFENSIIVGFDSIDGEVVTFLHALDVAERPIHIWMKDFADQIKSTLFGLLKKHFNINFNNISTNLVSRIPFQILLLISQINFTEKFGKLRENSFKDATVLLIEIKSIISHLNLLSATSEKITRKKLEGLIIEFIHFKNTLESLNSNNTKLTWNNFQKFYLKSDRVEIVQNEIAYAYGFEYIGIPERLVYTPLLNTCFISFLTALKQGLGSSPFGPAGTGKTETIKALGQNMGKMVVVFNCDEVFDYQSMNRLLSGVSRIGAWGCFDEFNRLDEKILSAISSDIETIQNCINSKKTPNSTIQKGIKIHNDTAIFITMNPHYSDRVTLPENLKKMFRAFSMESADIVVILEVLLTILGITNSFNISIRIHEFFTLLKTKLSSQYHYNFGLRTLKSIIRKCSQLKSTGIKLDENLLLQCISQQVEPILINSDLCIFKELFTHVFGDFAIPMFDANIEGKFEANLVSKGYVPSLNLLTKCKEFWNMLSSNQAIILNGEAGCGKTTIWETVKSTFEEVEKTTIAAHIIDTKTLTKEELYGSLDSVTFEWTDGIFTNILRNINDPDLPSFDKHNWIIFDSDLDPTYVETLNSVLDDNKVFTLPNGERLNIPETLSIIFEIDNINHATQATISRCNVIWVSDYLVTLHELFSSKLKKITEPYKTTNPKEVSYFKDCILTKLFTLPIFNNVCVQYKKLQHIMGESGIRNVSTLCVMCGFILEDLIRKEIKQPVFEIYIKRRFLLCILWSFSGDCSLKDRFAFSKYLVQEFNETGLDDNNMLDYTVSPVDGSFTLIDVPQTDIGPEYINRTDLVIPTIDTIRHENLVYRFLNSGKSFILCGPPGSGKTMSIYNSLKKLTNLEIIAMNFSKDITIKQFLVTIEQYCNYNTTADGYILLPKSFGKKLVVFCDEINLPKIDQYRSQPLILFLRELIEKGGFWNSKLKSWVQLQNISVIGACNPPEDVGRNELAPRFLRHLSVFMVDYPSKTSLYQIYSTFYRSIFKSIPGFGDYSKELTQASIDIYLACKEEFTIAKHAHYIFSPRELTRWVKGMHGTVCGRYNIDLPFFSSLWVYECLRIFSDRLVTKRDKIRFKKIVQDTINVYFPTLFQQNFNMDSLCFCNLLSTDYEQVDKTILRNFLVERLKTFSEEELDIELFVYDDMVDHILRIDRVLKQIQGHMMLVGPRKIGKTTLVKFVSWINGLKVLQPIIHRNYTSADFDDFLRDVLFQVSVRDERICLVIDQSNILEADFLERMNTLLANSEVPGLFEGHEREKLFTEIARKSQEFGLLLDSDDDLYDWFKTKIAKNLHVIFTINDPFDTGSAALITSPALFNRCVLNWMGEWSAATMKEVSRQVIAYVPLNESIYEAPSDEVLNGLPLPTARNVKEIVANAFIFIHKDYFSLFQEDSSKSQQSPGLFLDNLKTFKAIYIRKQNELEDRQRFIGIGLDKLKESVLIVKKLNRELSEKRERLERKDAEARLTLDQMLVDQNEAERKQEASIEIQKLLGIQKGEIKQRKDSVMKELAEVEPLVVEAQLGVKNIKKQQLIEIRSMSNPPTMVKTTMEAVCIILGYNVEDWKDIQQIIRSDNFIINIINFSVSHVLSASTKKVIYEKFLNNNVFTYEAVKHASKACGPLYQWVVAQAKYSEIQSKLEPLRIEMEKIKEDSIQTTARLLAIEEMIKELAVKLDDAKNKYSSLIRDVEIVKTEMSVVENKLKRSVKLIENLRSEGSRWSSNTEQFEKEWCNMLGNCLLSSSYNTYAGYHDQKQRLLIIKDIMRLLKHLNVGYDLAYTYNNYMVDSATRAEWVNKHGLRDDDLSVENFHLVTTSEKVPFIIDPDSACVSALQSFYGNCFCLSFLDPGYIKQVGNVLRFGGCLILKDAEFYDPIISKLIDKDYDTSSSRTVVRLGKNMVDVSSNFKLILFTKDPRVALPEFWGERTKIVNYTVGKGNIETQILDLTLANETPKIQGERKELLKLNGEYKSRLRCLERQLLEQLNNSGDGNILENDELITTLETIKENAEEIESKMGRTEEVIENLESTIDKYYVISDVCSKIYQVLENMESLHWFYKVSVNQFISYCRLMFQIEPFDEQTQHDRVLFLVNSVLKVIFKKFSKLFIQRDKYIFGMLLVKILLDIQPNQYTISFDKLMESFGVKSLDKIKGLIGEYLQITSSEENEATDFDFEMNEYIIASEHGLDGSFKVAQYAQVCGMDLKVISLGSKESTVNAEVELERLNGNKGNKADWLLLLQNLEMSSEWVETKLLQKINNNKGKLFMTCCLDNIANNNSSRTSIPTTLLLKSDKTCYEDNPSVFGVLNDIWFGNYIDKCDFEQRYPIELIHCFFLLAWFHSLSSVRCKKYSSIKSRNSRYENIDETDFKFMVNYLTQIFQDVSKKNIDIDNDIPWDVLRYLIVEIVYGGKFIKASGRGGDKDILEYITSLSKRLFNASSFKPDFELIENTELIAPLNKTTFASYDKWIKDAKREDKASWFGLSPDATGKLDEELCAVILKKIDSLK
ncbi:related to Dynein heavy chain, cytoplasmic [Saccharomycodes ludwigii]|uniref:Dynein heavy chain, cytoplasmic n=1 Tax=Saccharomycodes ludwigii TaxID=36035 RepID=A0A376B5D2_9ASCO|nr:related to Dynein heavy chain, cytoplasmic [Saccharomycodes ludwigii]